MKRVEACGDADCMECENERLRAAVRDLKARLRATRDIAAAVQERAPAALLRHVTDLRVKNWRKP